MALPKDLQDKLDAMKARTDRPSPEDLVENEDVAVETAAEDIPTDDVGDEPAPRRRSAVSELREEFAGEKARREALEREVEFLRKGSQPQAPAAREPDPIEAIQNVINGIGIDEQTWAAIISDPALGAREVSGLLKGLFQVAIQAAQARAVHETGRVLDTRLSAYDEERRSGTLHDQFWASNPDLKGFEEVVSGVAIGLAREHGDRQMPNHEVIAEVSKRSREKLASYGIRLNGGTPTSPRAVTRLRPAMADSGGGPSNTSSRPLNKTQQDLMRLAGYRRTA